MNHVFDRLKVSNYEQKTTKHSMCIHISILCLIISTYFTKFQIQTPRIFYSSHYEGYIIFGGVVDIQWQIKAEIVV